MSYGSSVYQSFNYEHSYFLLLLKHPKLKKISRIFGTGDCSIAPFVTQFFLFFCKKEKMVRWQLYYCFHFVRDSVWLGGSSNLGSRSIVGIYNNIRPLEVKFRQIKKLAFFWLVRILLFFYFLQLHLFGFLIVMNEKYGQTYESYQYCNCTISHVCTAR